MRNLYLISLLLVVVFFSSGGCGESGPVFTGDELLVQTDKLDVRFTRVRPFSGSYMLFGGTSLNQGVAFFNISLATLDMQTASAIYSRYPDFDRCKSPGAPLAQQAIGQLDIVSGDSSVHKKLKKSLSLHAKSTKGVGEAVCVTLGGQVLRIRSVIVRSLNEDITSQLPPQAIKDYYYVDSVELGTFQELISAGL